MDTTDGDVGEPASYVGLLARVSWSCRDGLEAWDGDRHLVVFLQRNIHTR
jgi:hypothetical protein